MIKISEKEVFEKLCFDNPWWFADGLGGIGQRMQAYPRRSYFKPFAELIKDRSINRAVVLMGPRRVGKTVMALHAIQDLIDSGIPPTAMLYANLEEPLYTGIPLAKLLSMFLAHWKHSKDSPVYVFFDEVQYLKEWEIHLKSLVDAYPAFRFVATGSAAAALRLKSTESGAGRFTDFVLPPLTFAEYLRFINRETELIRINGDVEHASPGSLERFEATDIDALNAEFINYLNFGGYPEAVMSPTIQSDTGRFIKSDIIDKVLLRDLPSLYGINDIQELNRLFTTLAYNTGNEVTLEALSRDAGVAKNTLKKYLEYLEAAFLVRRMSRIDQNARHFKKVTSFKVYLTNPSMRAALFGHVTPGNESVIGHLTETAIFSQWLHSKVIDNLYYSRWSGGEVDIVHLAPSDQKPQWIVEVKWSDRPWATLSELDNCVEFVERSHMTKPAYGPPVLVTTKSVSGQREYRGLIFQFIPSSLYAYLLGANILALKQPALDSL